MFEDQNGPKKQLKMLLKSVDLTTLRVKLKKNKIYETNNSIQISEYLLLFADFN